MAKVPPWSKRHPDSTHISPPDVASAAARSARKRRVGPVHEDGSYGVNVGGKEHVFDPDTSRVRKPRHIAGTNIGAGSNAKAKRKK